MLESPAKSSSSASDLKRYSCCPIPFVYHAHFRARKTPTALVSRSKSAPNSTRLIIVRPCPNQAPHTQIFLPLAFTDSSPPNFLSSKFGGRRLASTKKGGRVGGVRRVSLRPSTTPARERGVQELVRTRSRLTPHRSPQHSLGCGSRTTRRHAPRSTSPHRTALHFFSLQLSLAKAVTPNVERAHELEQCPHCRWRPALAEAQRLGSRAPAARSARTPRRSATPH